MEVHRWINISAISLNVSMLAGFTFAMLFCLFNKENRNNTNTIVKIITSLILIIFTVLAWNLSDNLQPVSYTEEILLMLKDISSVLYVLGIISLFLFPSTIYGLWYFTYNWIFHSINIFCKAYRNSRTEKIEMFFA